MPNFLIIGAAKCATTSLYQYLKQHPQVYMSPVKEPRFFAYEGEKLRFAGPGGDAVARSSITDLDAYCALFDGVRKEVAIGEATPNYLYIAKAPEQIRHYIPGAKLIAILRNPVERAYSNFMHNIRDGCEPVSDFGQALREEEARIRNNWAPRWHYRNQGFYHRDLLRYFDRFKRTQIKIFLYEEFEANPRAVLQDLFRFLNVDDKFTPDISARYNMSGIPQNKILNTLLKPPRRFQTFRNRFLPKRLRKMVLNVRNRNLVKPTISPAIRDPLVDEYKEDIQKLEKLIDKDLSVWMRTAKRIHSGASSGVGHG